MYYTASAEGYRYGDQRRPIGPCGSWKNLVSAFYILRASAMLKHVIAIGLTSVRLSVCPSVCPSVRHTLAPYQNS